MQQAGERTWRILWMSNDFDEANSRIAEFEREGWQVLWAADYVETLSAVKRRDVDLVLMHLPVEDMVDMDMPNVLRSVAQSVYLPVMILADDPPEEQRCGFLNSGADDILGRDTSGAELAARIRSILRIKQLQDALYASKSQLQQALQRERKLLAQFRRDNAELKELATTDSLTHVQNVRAFHSILQHEFRMARRYNQPLSLLTLDADHFKVINDSYGHPSGDYVLKELAVILKQSVRESDVVARIGGEEFSVLLPKAAPAQARAFAERIRQEVYDRKFIVFGKQIHLTISIGASTYPADAEITEPEMLAYFSDQALLLAKETGRDRVVAVADLNMDTRRRLRRQYLAAPLAAEKALDASRKPAAQEEEDALLAAAETPLQWHLL